MKIKLCSCLLILCTSRCLGQATQPASRSDPLRELFYAPFDGSPNAVIARGDPVPGKASISEYEDAKVGKGAHSKSIYNGIYYDGRGNIDLDRGTLAVFYKPNYEPADTAALNLLGVSSDLEGHWLDVVMFQQIQDTLYLQWFDCAPQIEQRAYQEGVWNQLKKDRHPPGLPIAKVLGRWKKGQWVHLAVVWDRARGMKVYEDGKLAGSDWDQPQARWDWNYDPRILHLGGTIYSTADFSADEFHVYGECLTDDQIAALAAGKKPSGAPMAPAPLNRDAELARMGWAPDDLAQIDSIAPGKPLQMTFAQIEQMYDARRRVAQPFEGFKATNWPLTKYGASSKGKRLEMTMREGQRFDHLRMFMQQPLKARIVDAQGAEIVPVQAQRPIWRAKLQQPCAAQNLNLDRESGKLGQIDFYTTDPAPQAPPSGVQMAFVSAEKLDPIPISVAGKVILGETPPRFENAVRATQKGGAAFDVAATAFGGLQILSEVLPPKLASDGVTVKLVTGKVAQPTPLRVTVKEPVWPQRDWLVGDVILEPSDADRSEYTLVLRGRPVVTPVYDGPEVPAYGGMIRQLPTELAVMIVAANDLTFHLGTGGTSVSLLVTDLQKALPIAVADQIEYCREAYAETNEGHVWDVEATESWGRLAWPLLYLVGIAPNERPVMQLATRVGWRKGDLPYDEPKNTAGAPDWAFWQLEALKDNYRVVHWMIDHRQLPNGEYGGVWGDDTDLVENWVDFVLMGDDSHKILNSLRMMYAGVWRENLVDGLSSTVQDALHSYEEGMGTIANQIIDDYGNPSAIEHTMRASSHYDMLMKQNPDGTWSFRSHYFGAPGPWEYGAFARDDGVNGLALVPAAYLLWYNHHPAPQPYIKGWTLNKGTYAGIITGALYELMDENEKANFRATHYAQVADEIIKGGRYVQHLNSIQDIVGVKDSQKQSMMSMATQYFFKEVPNTSSYSIHMTENYWMVYRATGDVKYITESFRKSCKLINNLDWTYTVAEPSTDRIPLPHTTLSRTRIGAFAVNRAGNGHFWPFHGISYTTGSESVAAFVTKNTEQELAVKLWSFDAGEHAMQARVWRLWPGTYHVALAKDANDDGVPEAVVWEADMPLERGSFLDLKLPPRQGLVLTIKAIKSAPMIFNRPDPAIGYDDVMLNKEGELQVTVHNVGVKPSGKITVRALDGSGKVLAENSIAPLEAPLDLKPRTAVVTFANVKPAAGAKLTVELTSDGEDLNPFNNRAELQN